MTAIKLTACSTCNGATAHTIGGKKCDNCWQVEHIDRIEGLRR